LVFLILKAWLEIRTRMLVFNLLSSLDAPHSWG
jgi:hypothetical protein